jgi:hypothetical protein
MPAKGTLMNTHSTATMPRSSPALVSSRVTLVANTREHQYSTLVRGFAGTGGIKGGDEFAGLLRDRLAQPLSTLARNIVERQFVAFWWRGETLLPMFQFAPSDMTLRPGVADVLSRLRDSLDEWELARWFATPKASLYGQAPADMISIDPIAVDRAAFLTCGRGSRSHSRSSGTPT